MAFNKVLFVGNDSATGLTEIYYDTATDPALADTMKRAVALAVLRAGMIAFAKTPTPGGASGLQIQRVRVSVIGNPRHTLFATQTNAVTAKKAPFQLPQPNNYFASLSDNQYSGVGVVFTTATGEQSKRTLSGIPDGWIGDQSFNPEPGWQTNFQKWALELTNGTWGTLVRVLPSPIPAGAQITAIVQGADGKPTITLNTGLVYACNQRIQVYGYVGEPGTPNLNGVYRAFPADSSALPVSWVLNKKFKPLAPVCKGFGFPPTYSVHPITNVVVTSARKKNRGRPLLLQRGRSRKAS